MNYQIIGNQIGKLDDQLKFNDAMKSAYDTRSVIAHIFGTPKYKLDYLYRDLTNDLAPLEAGCLEVIRQMQEEDVVICDNRKRAKRGLFRR